MKTILEHYKTSTDYERLVELMLFKGDVICIYGGHHLTTASLVPAKLYVIYGLGSSDTMTKFIEQCKEFDVRFIDPSN